MNFIFLIAIVFTEALVHGGQGVVPCQQRSQMTQYQQFVHRHILKEVFDRGSLQEWERYLERSNLCGRTPVQSFIDAHEGQVKQICGRTGRRVKGDTKGNLCISEGMMTVYDVTSENKRGCKVNWAAPYKRKVVVACNKVENKCCPVHYERYQNQQPDNLPCM